MASHNAPAAPLAVYHPPAPASTHRLHQVLRRYNKAVVHLRACLAQGRLTPVLGTLAGEALGLPALPQMLQNLAKQLGPAAPDLLPLAGSNPALAFGLLHQLHRSQVAQEWGAHDPDLLNAHQQTRLRNRWSLALRNALYANYLDPTGRPDLARYRHALATHTGYLKPLAELADQCPTLVNLHLHSALEDLLTLRAQHISTPTRPNKPQAVWGTAHGTIPSRRILHPNGYVPCDVTVSDFGEPVAALGQGLVDQLLHTGGDRVGALANAFSQTTCLFLGTEPDAAPLSYHLRAAARRNPAHVNVWVDLLPDDPADEGQPGNHAQHLPNQQALDDHRFAAYNLLTLRLGPSGLNALLHLLAMPTPAFYELARQAGARTKFVMYVSGSSGVGKSTLLASMGAVYTHREFPDGLLPEMLEDVQSLAEGPQAVVARIQAYVDEQVAKKLRQIDEGPDGLHLVDRGPLDTLSHLPGLADVGPRAQALVQDFDRLGASPLLPGALIVLTAGGGTLAARATQTMRNHAPDHIIGQQELLLHVYQPLPDAQPLILETERRPPAEVAKAVAKYLFREPYAEYDFQARLAQLAQNG